MGFLPALLLIWYCNWFKYCQLSESGTVSLVGQFLSNVTNKL